MSQNHETEEQRRKRLKKARDKAHKLEQGHLDDAPEPLSRSHQGQPLGQLPPMDLVK